MGFRFSFIAVVPYVNAAGAQDFYKLFLGWAMLQHHST
jgi:hypothetical protein